MSNVKFDLKDLLNKQSLRNTEVKEKKEFKVETLSVHNLIPSEDNFYSVDDIKDLKDAIELFGGVKQNLIVTPVGAGKYKVIAGHKRRLASLELVEEGKKQFEMVPCSVEVVESTVEKLLLIMTNSTTRQLTDYEKMRQAQELKILLEEYKKQENIPGRTRDLIADILGTSSTQVGRMEAINKNLSDGFKEEFRKDNVGISTAYELSGLNKEQQEAAMEKYKENGSITINEVKQIKQEDNPVEVKHEVEEVHEEPMKGQQSFYGEVEQQQEGQQTVNEYTPDEILQDLLEVHQLITLEELDVLIGILQACNARGRLK